MAKNILCLKFEEFYLHNLLEIFIIENHEKQTVKHAIRVFFHLKESFNEDKKQLRYICKENPHMVLPSLLFISILLKRPLERSFLGNIALSGSTPCFCCTKETT